MSHEAVWDEQIGEDIRVGSFNVTNLMNQLHIKFAENQLICFFKGIKFFILENIEYLNSKGLPHARALG